MMRCQQAGEMKRPGVPATTGGSNALAAAARGRGMLAWSVLLARAVDMIVNGAILIAMASSRARRRRDGARHIGGMCSPYLYIVLLITL